MGRTINKILSCPVCGHGKKATTHSYGTYRVYLSGTTMMLRCKTCKHVQHFKIIRGGYTIGSKNNGGKQ